MWRDLRAEYGSDVTVERLKRLAVKRLARMSRDRVAGARREHCTNCGVKHGDWWKPGDPLHRERIGAGIDRDPDGWHYLAPLPGGGYVFSLCPDCAALDGWGIPMLRDREGGSQGDFRRRRLMARRPRTSDQRPLLGPVASP